MTREEAIQVLNMVEAHGSLVKQAKEVAIESLKQPYEQVKWERDLAISQLEELGYSLGEKVEPVIKQSKIDKVVEDLKARAYDAEDFLGIRNEVVDVEDCIEMLEKIKEV